MFFIIGKTYVKDQLDLSKKYESWTTDKNISALFFETGEDLTIQELEAKILKKIIHELMIIFDEKESLGFLGILNEKIFDKYGYKLPSEENLCWLKSHQANTTVKYTFSALRALSYEARALKELGVASEKQDLFLKQTCSVKAKKMSSVIEGNNPMGQLITTLGTNLIQKDCPLQSQSSPQEIIEKLSEIRLTSIDESHSVSICEFLERPTMGIPISTSAQGGPRPKGGW